MTRLKQLCLLQSKRLAAGLCLAWALLLVAPLRATPAAVDVVINDCSTQDQLATALNGPSGLIAFSCGPSPVTIVLTQDGGFNAVPFSTFTIDGGNLVTLSGGNNNRVFNVASTAALTLSNIILSNGYAASSPGLPSQGGAILNNGGVLVLNNVTVRDSQSSYAGGAIENASGSAVLVDSLIENNQSDYGGGIDSIATLTLINTAVRSNQALTHTGGGLDISGTVSIDNSLITGNQAAITGGGINSLGTLTLTNSTLNGNLAHLDGGGIWTGGIATLTNVTLSGNSATYDGGGIFNGGTANLYNATIVSNTADSDNNTTGTGGGVFNPALLTVNLHNSLVAGNKQGNGTSDCHGTLGSYGRNLLYDLADCTLADGPNSSHSLISSLASIGPLQNNGGPTLTHMPRLGSEIIDGGDPAGCTGPGAVLLLFDQRGLPRTDNGSDCDVGAVERQLTDFDTPHWLYLPLVVR